MEFLLLFMPAVFAVYYILPDSLKNYWLLVSSLSFYAWGEPVFVLVMMTSIAFNYMMAVSIDMVRKDKRFQRLVLGIDVLFNLGILFIFKYLNFVTAFIHKVIPGTVSLFPETSFALPIGISFFTFQALSYVIDVYRGTPAQKNPFFLGLYISLFPQLIAGPIVRYTTVKDQISNRKITMDDFSSGVVRFMKGFNKKVLLANVLSEAADKAFGAWTRSAGMAWLGAVCYTLQIYYDFSGYSDMAIGMGKMLGFHFLENFDLPYISGTVTEFWRRWHISLGTWFRDYVYFPMGGSRVGSRKRLVFNLLAVWLLTGIWHGANWTFILWGVSYGIIIIIEKLNRIPERLQRSKRISRFFYYCFTMFMVILGWVLFRSESVKDAAAYIRTMFGRGVPLTDGAYVFYSREYIFYLVLGIIGSTQLLKRCREKLFLYSDRLGSAADCVSDLSQLGLFVCSLSFLVMNAHNPFIYFNF